MSDASIKELTITDASSGRRFRVLVLKPPGERRRPARWLLVLDGDSYFRSAVEAVRANGNAPDVCVIGVGYPQDTAFAAEVLSRFEDLPRPMLAQPQDILIPSLARIFDLTPPASDHALAQSYVPGAIKLRSEHVGGLDEFLALIALKILPAVQDVVPLDPEQGALFGHSLGGLAVIRALLNGPVPYRAFLASSPSLWWDDWAVTRMWRTAVSTAQLSSRQARLLISAGEDEETLRPDDAASDGLDPVALETLLARCRMVGSVKALAEELRGRPEFRAIAISEIVFPKIGHGLSPWCALAYGVDFAFRSRR